MPEREVIIALLKKVERRRRANRWLKTITAGLSVSLLIPIAFKLLDLAFPFRGRTVTLFLVAWAAGSSAYFIWRLRGRESLADIAAKLDHQAASHDQIKTAYWFIRNPTNSPWVDAQIRHAAREAGDMKLDTLFPRLIPRTSYLAVGLVLLLSAMNFIPPSFNHNWFYLQAAPAF